MHTHPHIFSHPLMPCDTYYNINAMQIDVIPYYLRSNDKKNLYMFISKYRQKQFSLNIFFSMESENVEYRRGDLTVHAAGREMLRWMWRGTKEWILQWFLQLLCTLHWLSSPTDKSFVSHSSLYPQPSGTALLCTLFPRNHINVMWRLIHFTPS